MQFSLDEPHYMVSNGTLVSQRAKEIANILKKRYNKSCDLEISTNCIEGRDLYLRYMHTEQN